MKIRFLIPTLAILLIFSCKTKKDAVSDQQPTVAPQQTKQLTAEEKDKLLQSEYKPEVKSKVSAGDMEFLSQKAMEKANLTCKKQNIQKRIDAGEQVDPSELSYIDSMLEEINKLMLKFAKEPTYMQYFEAKFAEYLKGCSK
jgi:hypothetical protein